MPNKLRVYMEDGTQWDIPIVVIAESYAKYFCGVDEVPYEQSLREALDLFNLDDGDAEDWASNNMNWEDVVGSAVKVDVPARVTDYELEWSNSIKKVIEEN